MRPLNIAIVSTGGAGRAHATRFEKNPKSRLRALFDTKEESLVDMESYETRGAYLTTDYRRILNDDKIDVISVCSPDSTHSTYAVEAMEAGKHVLVEKPMATTIEQCREMASAVDASRGIFGVHHQMRYVPCYVKARERVLNGAIGIPFVAEASYVHDMRERATRHDSWRIDANYPQQVALGASSHTIDLVRWILGSEVTEVFSYATHLGWPEYPDWDTVLTLLKFRNGAIANVMFTIASERKQLNSLTIYGSGGAIVDNILLKGDGLREVFHISKEPRRSILAKLTMAGLLRKMKSTQSFPFSSYEHGVACDAIVDEYLTCVLEKKRFPIDFWEGAYTVQICLASIESYRLGEPVKIERMFR